jgi:hypothetical protein
MPVPIQWREVCAIALLELFEELDGVVAIHAEVV